VNWGGLSEPEQLLLADAQTSGGLLVATREPDALVAALAAKGVTGHVVGNVVDGPPGAVTVSE
jgi:selenophosphate synthase